MEKNKARHDKNSQVKAKFIFNPNAGMKRKFLPNPKTNTSLEDIKALMEQYQIPVDLSPTKGPGHATELAKNASKEGYKLVIVAGGDGTVGEAANGLVGSDVTLGIIPLGSFMNIARMLSIPLDIEKALMLIKIGRSRKIDVGQVTKIAEVLEPTPKHIVKKAEKGIKKEGFFFLESAGLGLEAQLHEYVLEWERGNWGAVWKAIKTLFEYYGYPAKITLDKEVITTRATLIAVSNGPYAGASLPVAPKAKLNDHRLTVSLFKMSKWEIIKFFLRAIKYGKKYSPKLEVHKAHRVRIETKVERLVHTDARLYGTTPVEFEIVPNALNIITGFPESEETSLIKRTSLDP